MKNVFTIAGLGMAASLFTLQTAAWAQDVVRDPTPGEAQIGAGTPPSQLPPPRSDYDAQPKVAAPMAENGPGVTQQAGVGGTQAYGRVGVLELGGSAGFQLSESASRFELAPFIGLFIADNLQISVITGVSRNSIENPVTGKDSVNSEFKLLLEPSYHLPFSQTLFGFFGLGAGVAYLQKETGFAMQPRMGLNILIGRSGILTPSLNVAYSTVDAVSTPNGTVLGVQTSYGLNVGYTVMW